MKIIRYEKKKNGMYQLFFEDDYDVDIHEEIILKYQLLFKKDISKDVLDKMLLENEKYIAYNLSVKYISTKLRTKKEIFSYLSKKNINENSINEVISLLEKNKILNDDLYANAYVNDRILLSNDGPYKIKNSLIELGINENSVESSLLVFSDDLQREKINKIIDKEIKTNRTKSNETLKNKILQKIFLLGYDKHIAIELLNKKRFNNDKDLAKIQYKKIYNKLSKKYSGSELELKVKQKMYSLGFRDNIE